MKIDYAISSTFVADKQNLKAESASLKRNIMPPDYDERE